MSGKQPRENSNIRERPGKKVANLRNLNLENTDVNADTYAPAGDDVNHNLSGTRVSKNFALDICLSKEKLNPQNSNDKQSENTISYTCSAVSLIGFE